MMYLCIGCDRGPENIFEYVSMFRDEGYESATEYVEHEEGTFNPESGHFYCDTCYIKAGMPLGVAP